MRRSKTSNGRGFVWTMPARLGSLGWSDNIAFPARVSNTKSISGKCRISARANLSR
jgi:hypothetical protein